MIKKIFSVVTALLFAGWSGETSSAFSNTQALQIYGLSFTTSQIHRNGSGPVTLHHNGMITDYPTIQGAVDASVTGDTVSLGQGIFTEQVSITKGITLMGADSSLTIIRSPLAAELVQSGGTWKNLKAQDVYAVIGVKTNDQSQVVIKNLKVDGFDQGFLPDALYPDKNAYAFDGIAVMNSNVLIEGVYITRVRELATDYGQSQPGYLPEDQPAGMNHNEAILAESSSGSGNHHVEIRNCYIAKYQKTGILAWGPTLNVNIHNNTIQGYGQTLYSTGNAIQIASSDRSSMGGANGDRRGTTGQIVHNTIEGVGIIIPAPGQPGSYLNLGLGGSTGILLWEAGDGFLIRGNAITRAEYIPSWHSSATSNDGGYSNQAIDVVSVGSVLVDSNTIINFDHGVMIETATKTPDVTARFNEIHSNTHDYFSGSGDDHFTLGNLAEVVAYYAEDNGYDTLSGFGPGDRIYVNDYNKTGCVNGLINGWPTVSFTGGSVTEGDGLLVAPNSMQIACPGNHTTLYIDTDSTSGPAELIITLKGRYNTGNFLLSGGFIEYQKSVPIVRTGQITSLSDSSLMLGDEVIMDGGDPVTLGGICWSLTINPVITQDTAVSGSGTGTYSAIAGNLMSNHRYFLKAFAVNATGTGYGAGTDTVTLCKIPGAPSITSPTPQSLDISIITNGNPDTTEYAIQDSASSKYLQTDGSLSNGIIWQSASEWGTITITGLTGGQTYSFRVIARNLDLIETTPGPWQKGSTCIQPTHGGVISGNQRICEGEVPNVIESDTLPTNYGGILEYKWQRAENPDTLVFIDIQDSNDTVFAPSALTADTWFRRCAKVTCRLEWEDEGISNAVKITVDPESAAGIISGDSMVCSGGAAALSTSGFTGSIIKWQSSIDSITWNDIIDSDTVAISILNLTVKTWFRTEVRSGACSEVFTDPFPVSIKNGFALNGYAKYENNPKTPLNGLKILLKNGTSIVDSAYTTSAGYYEFNNLANGNYGLEIKSAHPSGLWQTWGGVTNTDYLLVSKHIAGTQYLPVNPPVVQVTASTKLPHPAINNLDATAIRQAAKYPTTGYSYFDIPKWVFSGMDAATALDDITVVCSDVVRDIRGLCAGDVNGTYVPVSGVKTLHATSLQLMHRGTLPLTDEIVFPIRVDRDMELGAITLYLDYDPSVMTVTNVTTVTNSPELWYSISEPTSNLKPETLNLKPETLNLKPSTLNTLAIGWMSLEPVPVSAGQAVILIHARMRAGVETHGRASVQMAHPIRFILNENPLSELANGEGEIIEGAILEMPEARANTTETSEEFILSVFPNPSNQIVNVDYLLTSEELVSFVLTNSQGINVLKTDDKPMAVGTHRESFDVSGLMPGVYMLKATAGTSVSFRKVVVVR